MPYPEALQRALVAGTPLRLRVALSGISFPAAAPACPPELQPGRGYLWVRAPELSTGHTLPAPQGTSIRVSFELGVRHYAFASRLEGTRTLPSALGGEAWVLKVPDALEPLQRRGAFRLRDWVMPPLKARFWSLGGGHRGILEGIAEDLSSSGVGLAVPKAVAGAFPIGQEVGLNIVLGDGRRPLVLKGNVRSRRHRIRQPFVKIGISFSNPGTGASVSLLMRYVAEQERIRIRRDRMQSDLEEGKDA